MSFQTPSWWKHHQATGQTRYHDNITRAVYSPISPVRKEHGFLRRAPLPVSRPSDAPAVPVPSINPPKTPPPNPSIPVNTDPKSYGSIPPVIKPFTPQRSSAGHPFTPPAGVPPNSKTIYMPPPRSGTASSLPSLQDTGSVPHPGQTAPDDRHLAMHTAGALNRAKTWLEQTNHPAADADFRYNNFKQKNAHVLDGAQPVAHSGGVPVSSVFSTVPAAPVSTYHAPEADTNPVAYMQSLRNLDPASLQTMYQKAANTHAAWWGHGEGDTHIVASKREQNESDHYYTGWGDENKDLSREQRLQLLDKDLPLASQGTLVYTFGHYKGTFPWMDDPLSGPPLTNNQMIQYIFSRNVAPRDIFKNFNEVQAAMQSELQASTARGSASGGSSNMLQRYSQWFNPSTLEGLRLASQNLPFGPAAEWGGLRDPRNGGQAVGRGIVAVGRTFVGMIANSFSQLFAHKNIIKDPLSDPDYFAAKLFPKAMEGMIGNYWTRKDLAEQMQQTLSAAQQPLFDYKGMAYFKAKYPNETAERIYGRWQTNTAWVGVADTGSAASKLVWNLISSGLGAVQVEENVFKAELGHGQDMEQEFEKWHNITNAGNDIIGKVWGTMGAAMSNEVSMAQIQKGLRKGQSNVPTVSGTGGETLVTNVLNAGMSALGVFDLVGGVATYAGGGFMNVSHFIENGSFLDNGNAAFTAKWQNALGQGLNNAFRPGVLSDADLLQLRRTRLPQMLQQATDEARAANPGSTPEEIEQIGRDNANKQFEDYVSKSSEAQGDAFVPTPGKIARTMGLQRTMSQLISEYRKPYIDSSMDANVVVEKMKKTLNARVQAGDSSPAEVLEQLQSLKDAGLSDDALGEMVARGAARYDLLNAQTKYVSSLRNFVADTGQYATEFEALSNAKDGGIKNSVGGAFHEQISNFLNDPSGFRPGGSMDFSAPTANYFDGIVGRNANLSTQFRGYVRGLKYGADAFTVRPRGGPAPTALETMIQKTMRSEAMMAGKFTGGGITGEAYRSWFEDNAWKGSGVMSREIYDTASHSSAVWKTVFDEHNANWWDESVKDMPDADKENPAKVLEHVYNRAANQQLVNAWQRIDPQGRYESYLDSNRYMDPTEFRNQFKDSMQRVNSADFKSWENRTNAGFQDYVQQRLELQYGVKDYKDTPYGKLLQNLADQGVFQSPTNARLFLDSWGDDGSPGAQVEEQLKAQMKSLVANYDDVYNSWKELSKDAYRSTEWFTGQLQQGLKNFTQEYAKLGDDLREGITTTGDKEFQTRFRNIMNDMNNVRGIATESQFWEMIETNEKSMTQRVAGVTRDVLQNTGKTAVAGTTELGRLIGVGLTSVGIGSYTAADIATIAAAAYVGKSLGMPIASILNYMTTGPIALATTPVAAAVGGVIGAASAGAMARLAINAAKEAGYDVAGSQTWVTTNIGKLTGKVFNEAIAKPAAAIFNKIDEGIRATDAQIPGTLRHSILDSFNMLQAANEARSGPFNVKFINTVMQVRDVLNDTMQKQSNLLGEQMQALHQKFVEWQNTPSKDFKSAKDFAATLTADYDSIRATATNLRNSIGDRAQIANYYQGFSGTTWAAKAVFENTPEYQANADLIKSLANDPFKANMSKAMEAYLDNFISGTPRTWSDVEGLMQNKDFSDMGIKDEILPSEQRSVQSAIVDAAAMKFKDWGATNAYTHVWKASWDAFAGTPAGKEYLRVLGEAKDARATVIGEINTAYRNWLADTTEGDRMADIKQKAWNDPEASKVMQRNVDANKAQSQTTWYQKLGGQVAPGLKDLIWGGYVHDFIGSVISKATGEEYIGTKSLQAQVFSDYVRTQLTTVFTSDIHTGLVTRSAVSRVYNMFTNLQQTNLASFNFGGFDVQGAADTALRAGVTYLQGTNKQMQQMQQRARVLADYTANMKETHGFLYEGLIQTSAAMQARALGKTDDFQNYYAKSRISLQNELEYIKSTKDIYATIRQVPLEKRTDPHGVFYMSNDPQFWTDTHLDNALAWVDKQQQSVQHLLDSTQMDALPAADADASKTASTTSATNPQALQGVPTGKDRTTQAAPEFSMDTIPTAATTGRPSAAPPAPPAPPPTQQS